MHVKKKPQNSKLFIVEKNYKCSNRFFEAGGRQRPLARSITSDTFEELNETNNFSFHGLKLRLILRHVLQGKAMRQKITFHRLS